MALLKFDSIAPGYWKDIPSELWNDYQWQLRHRITSLAGLVEHLALSPSETKGVLSSAGKLALSITPHFFNLIDKNDEHCPIRRQVIPRIEEMTVSHGDMLDPCGEDSHMPVPGLVHRYPDRVLFLVTDRCASYCRYCTRSRVVSGVSEHKLRMQWEAAFNYLSEHPEVRDVLISGGDALLLSDKAIDRLLTRLRTIPHIEIVRIGSRIPIFLPQRITNNLCEILSKHHPLLLSIHVNHPKELTLEVKQALEKLSNAGIPLGNQSVLLRGVNDSLTIQKELVHKLLACRVKPYYLYQCDPITGSAHLRTSVEEGIAIIEGLRGHTSGYAIPQYVIDAPGGGGKIPINPNYIIEKTTQGVLLRNYENKHFFYPNNQTSKIKPCTKKEH